MTEHMTDERISDERLAELLEDHEFFHAEVTADQRDAHRQFHWADIPLALRELQARRAAEAWRPIDSAPKDGTTVLLNTPSDWVVAHYWKGKDTEGWTAGWETVGGYDVGERWIRNADLWLPIPPLPEPPQ